jgi:SAM-dependent methyltransferase
MPTRSESLVALASYQDRIERAIAQHQHHDQRRHILVELLRDGFGLTVDELVLEQNVRVAKTRGRVDLLYRSLAWEVKRDLDLERDDLIRELGLYLASLGEQAFGIGTDGLHFEVYRLDNKDLRRVAEFALDADGVSPDEALDWFDSFLFALDDVAPTTEAILERFGLESAVFLSSVSELAAIWNEIADETDVAIKHDEWQKLLEVVYGTRVGTGDLWLRHTYLVMVARLLAYLAITHELPARGDELGVLTGDLFTRLGLQNLVERDFFSWPSFPAVAGRASILLRGLARHLGLFALDALDEDLLKQLYETMVDPAEREWLGEFYTPDWLADVVLERAGFNSETRTLDPSCGSGTFLFAAIRRLRQEGLSGADLVRVAREKVVGLDIHPLALAISRANYVLALRRDLHELGEALTIPVFMADTLAAPEQGFGRMVEIEAPTENLPPGLPRYFQLPTERDEGQTASIAQVVDLVDDLSDPALDAGQATTGLLARLREWGLRRYSDVWKENLRLLRALRERHLDTIWSFILTNAARPHEIAANPVDLVIGNPPWLTVMEMAGTDYKERVKIIAAEFRLGSSARRRMADISHIDTSTVFACFCAEHFLPEQSGRVAFVLPRSVLAGARQHANFREGRAALWYKPVEAIDLDEVSPLFRIPACVMIFDKTPEQEKPPPPWSWPTTVLSGQLPRKNASRAEADAVLNERQAVDIAMDARPSPYLRETRQGVDIRPRAFWLAEPDPEAKVLDRARPYLRSRQRAVQRAQPLWRGISISGRVEAEYLYGTSLEVDPFRVGGLTLVVLPIERLNGRVRVLSEAEILERGDVGMAQWIARAEEEFRAGLQRSDRVFDGTVIDYLNTQNKLAEQRPAAPRVVWAAGGTHVRAAVAPSDVAEVSGLPIQGYVVDLNLYSIACETAREAHYLCAVINSKRVTEAISHDQPRGQYGARHIHRRPVELVPIPRFDPMEADHQELSDLSEKAHARAAAIPFDSSRNRQRYVEAFGDLAGEINDLADRVLTALP